MHWILFCGLAHRSGGGVQSLLATRVCLYSCHLILVGVPHFMLEVQV